MRTLVVDDCVEPGARRARRHDVDDTLGHAGLLEQIDHPQRRQRGLLRRLDDAPLPAASAGASLRVIIAAGKFHGVTSATTPDRRVEHEDPVGARRGGRHRAADRARPPRRSTGRTPRSRRPRPGRRPAACRAPDDQRGHSSACSRHQLQAAQDLGALARRPSPRTSRPRRSRVPFPIHRRHRPPPRSRRSRPPRAKRLAASPGRGSSKGAFRVRWCRDTPPTHQVEWV